MGLFRPLGFGYRGGVLATCVRPSALAIQWPVSATHPAASTIRTAAPFQSQLDPLAGDSRGSSRSERKLCVGRAFALPGIAADLHGAMPRLVPEPELTRQSDERQLRPRRLLHATGRTAERHLCPPPLATRTVVWTQGPDFPPGFLQLRLANPIRGSEFRHPLRTSLDHRRELLVRADHVGWHPASPPAFRPPVSQRIEERDFGFRDSRAPVDIHSILGVVARQQIGSRRFPGAHDLHGHVRDSRDKPYYLFDGLIQALGQADECYPVSPSIRAPMRSSAAMRRAIPLKCRASPSANGRPKISRSR